MSIRILLADDHAVLRDGLRALLDAEHGFEVVACVADGHAAVAAALELQPHVAVMDIRMPGLNGIEATRLLRERSASLRVLMLSMHGSSEHVYRAFEAGADGYLLKESAGTEVVAAVRAVAAGRRYMSRPVADAFAPGVGSARGGSPLERLSGRERELLQLLAEGQGNAEIARRLALSVKTVETYRSRLLAKLGLQDIAALVRFALDHGVI